MLLTDEQRAFQDVAQRFAREKLAPRYQLRERETVIERALVREMGSLGLIAPDLPEEYGGLGAPSETSGVIIEALAYGDFNVAYVQLLGSLNGQIIARHASPELASEWLPRIVSGESLVAIALTEPRGGSDAGNLVLSARPRDGGYVLNGEKSSISVADQADAVLVFARTGRVEDGPRGVSAFLVPMNSPGVRTSRFDDLGSKVVGRGSIFFDDVEVPLSHRLAAEDAGFVQVMQGFDFSRALAAMTRQPRLLSACNLWSSARPAHDLLACRPPAWRVRSRATIIFMTCAVPSPISSPMTSRSRCWCGRSSDQP